MNYLHQESHRTAQAIDTTVSTISFEVLSMLNLIIDLLPRKDLLASSLVQHPNTSPDTLHLIQQVMSVHNPLSCTVQALAPRMTDVNF
jgi:hypothetical protein